MTETGFSVDGVSLSIPVLAAAMDAVVSPRFASRMHDYGGLGVMNLEGVQARYQDATRYWTASSALPGRR